MGRTAKGWTLKWRPSKDGPVAHVRFTWNRSREEITTGSRDPREAPKVAARIYADWISGRLKKTASKTLMHPATPLSEPCADWLAAIENELGAGTGGTYEVYIRHWCRAMPTLGDVTTAGIGDYQRARLGSVQRVTVIKERSALLRCLTWFVERGILSEVPEFPPLGRKSKGKRHKQGRRLPTFAYSEEQCEAVLAKLSDETRPYYEVLWETALRPISTVQRLDRPDLTPFGLHIRPECDKEGRERTIPVSARARRALEAGLPFGPADRRSTLAAAVKSVLGEDVKFTAYDFKHARITKWVDEGRPLTGISELTGVSIETLTKRYAHRSRRAAEVVLWGHSGAEPAADSCEGRDLNPDGSYPASTSSKLHAKQTRLRGREASRNVAEFHKPRSDSGAGPHYSDPSLPAAVRIALLARSRGAA